jgi:fructose-1,6-bisphosphatase/inositol monophosphatase family enzyme
MFIVLKIKMDYLDSLFYAVNQAQEAVLQCLKTKEAKAIIKEKDSDLTRKVDLIAEEKIEESLKNEGIEAYLISEETPIKKIGRDLKPQLIIIIDPLDGTRNFVNSIPFYSISIAVGKVKNEDAQLNDLFIGIVKDVLRGDVFYAVKGEGSYYNNEKIKKENSFYEEEDKPLISLYTYGNELPLKNLSNLLKKFKIRVLGSLALELCYTALGRLDGVIDARGKARIVDFAAGKIILEEAGGVISSLNGKPIEASLKNAKSGFNLIAAKNMFLHKTLVNILKG